MSIYVDTDEEGLPRIVASEGTLLGLRAPHLWGGGTRRKLDSSPEVQAALRSVRRELDSLGELGDAMSDQKMSDEELEGWGDDQSVFLPTWNYDKQGVLIGRLIDQETVETEGISGEVRPVLKFTVGTDDGEKYTVWGSAVLSRILPRHMGHLIRIEDKGIEELGQGQRFRYFDVRCRDHASSEHTASLD